jgi:hypothetical protein
LVGAIGVDGFIVLGNSQRSAAQAQKE